jgi:hypothetical protein
MIQSVVLMLTRLKSCYTGADIFVNCAVSNTYNFLFPCKTACPGDCGISSLYQLYVAVVSFNNLLAVTTVILSQILFLTFLSSCWGYFRQSYYNPQNTIMKEI